MIHTAHIFYCNTLSEKEKSMKYPAALDRQEQTLNSYISQLEKTTLGHFLEMMVKVHAVITSDSYFHNWCLYLTFIIQWMDSVVRTH